MGGPQQLCSPLLLKLHLDLLTRIMGSLSSPTDLTPYQVLSKYKKFPSPDEEFWWDHAASTLADLIKWTKATPAQEYEFLQFFYEHVIPNFSWYRPYDVPGRAWNTGITPSGLPLEYSVNWRNIDANAMVRVGVEPISQFAGTARDPYSHYKIWDTLNQLSQVKALKSFDLELWRHFSSALCTSREEEALLDQTRTLPESFSIAKMQHSMGFDFCDDEVVVKIYLIPNMKARASGTPLAELLTGSIHAIYRDTIDRETLATVINYLDRTSNFNDATWFSFDCIPRSQSRIKLYGSDFRTTWSRAEDLWTVGGRYTDAVTMKGLAYLKELWDLLPIQDFETLPEQAVQNPPMLWAYEIRPGDKIPSPRIYIPGHCLNDKKVADGLSAFFKRVGWSDLGDQYTDRLFSML